MDRLQSWKWHGSGNNAEISLINSVIRNQTRLRAVEGGGPCLIKCQTTRWSAALSSNVSLPHAINRALRGAVWITQRPKMIGNINSQFASRNQQGLIWCSVGHVTTSNLGGTKPAYTTVWHDRYRGTSVIKNNPSLEGPTVGLYLGSYGGHRGGAVSYERGTPDTPAGKARRGTRPVDGQFYSTGVPHL